MCIIFSSLWYLSKVEHILRYETSLKREENWNKPCNLWIKTVYQQQEKLWKDYKLIETEQLPSNCKKKKKVFFFSVKPRQGNNFLKLKEKNEYTAYQKLMGQNDGRT